jgi:hypothetical protein
MQASLHGHGAHIQGGGRPSVAPSLQNHPTNHLLGAGIQTLQQLFDTHLASRLILSGLTRGRGDLFEQGIIKRGWSTQLAMPLEQLPLLLRYPHWYALALERSLLLALQTALQFGLTTGQAHGSGYIPQVVENGPANVGPGKGPKGGLVFRAEQFRSPDQPEQPDLNQIVLRFWAATPVVMGQRGHKVLMSIHKGISALQCLNGGCGWVALTAKGTGTTSGAGVHGTACSEFGRHRDKDSDP